MKESYIKAFVEIEHINKLFLDVIKSEISKMGISDINEVQSLILYKIGDRRVLVGDLTKHGYYLGTNVAHNMQKMIKNGYLLKYKRQDDTRCSIVMLSKKGVDFHKKLDDLFGSQANYLNEGMDLEELNRFQNILISLGCFWKHLLFPNKNINEGGENKSDETSDDHWPT